MYLSHTKNVCKSQNTMKPFSLCFKLINNEVLWFPPVVLGIIDKTYNYQDFLSFLKFIDYSFQTFILANFKSWAKPTHALLFEEEKISFNSTDIWISGFPVKIIVALLPFV